MCIWMYVYILYMYIFTYVHTSPHRKYMWFAAFAFIVLPYAILHIDPQLAYTHICVLI